MKKKWIGVVTSALCALSLLTAPSTAWAGEATWSGSAPDSTPAAAGSITTGTGETSMNIDVNASVQNSGNKIRYSVDVVYGDMQFVYDYGQVWDPVTHTYVKGDSERISGGWVTSYVDGVNNSIVIENNSNYPITANFSYVPDTPSGSTKGTAFNANNMQTGAVIGIFSTNNSDFAGINTDDELKGYGAAKTTAKKTLTSNIDWDYSQLTTNDYVDYGHLDTKDPNAGKNRLEVYFTLCGVPDADCWMATQAGANGGTSNMSKVGKIKLEITPCTTNIVKTP